MAGTVVRLPGVSALANNTPKTSRSKMETVIVTLKAVESWVVPNFQRPVRINAKVQALADNIREEETIPGVITIGKMGGQSFLIDGQHRAEAFKLAGIDMALADVRICHYNTMAEMSQAFVDLNSALVKMRPDDVLRGLEASTPGLARIRKRCPYIGFDHVRRGANSPLQSMATTLRTWYASETDTPTTSTAATVELAGRLTLEEADALCDFIETCMEAWGGDDEYRRLWANLNLGLCAWLWRRTVVKKYNPRTVRLSRADWVKCLMSLSANGKYIDWLVGRKLGEKDRSPAYARLRQIFQTRMRSENISNTKLPSPPWSKGGGRHIPNM